MAMTGPGYDVTFLGLPLPMPTLTEETTDLAYQHFSVLLRPDRRLAGLTVVNIHGLLLIDIERTSDPWVLDPRVPAAQAGNALYVSNDFDRGHLVRRRDPGWGPRRAANDDTFHYPNAAPQAADFNQSKELWAGLEDYLLEHAATYEQRLTVFTGPVLAVDDPTYRGVQIPRRFWKIAAWFTTSNWPPPAYLLDQTDLIGPILAAESPEPRPGPPPWGPTGHSRYPWPPPRDTGIDSPELRAADIYGIAMMSDPAMPDAIELTSYTEIRMPGHASRPGRPSAAGPGHPPSATCRIFSLLLLGTLSLSPALVVVSQSPPSGAGSTVRSRP